MEVDFEESVIVGSMVTKSYSDLPTVQQAVTKYFASKSFGIFECRNQYFAIWKSEDQIKNAKDNSKESAFYFLHPNAKESFLEKFPSSGMDRSKLEIACVLRFVDPNELAAVLSEEFQESEDSSNEFTIHAVEILSISEPMEPEEIEIEKLSMEKPALRAYSAMGDTGAVLKGTFNQNDSFMFGKETRGKQQAAIALVSLGMTKLFDSHLWERELLDDLLKMGDKLCLDNLKNLPVDNGDENRDYLLPDEIEKEFFLGVNKILFEIQPEFVSGKVPEMPKCFDEFFKENKKGILRQEKVRFIFIIEFSLINYIKNVNFYRMFCPYR